MWYSTWALGKGSLCQIFCPEARGNSVPMLVFRHQIKLLGKNLSILQASTAGRMWMVLRWESGTRISSHWLDGQWRKLRVEPRLLVEILYLCFARSKRLLLHVGYEDGFYIRVTCDSYDVYTWSPPDASKSKNSCPYSFILLRLSFRYQVCELCFEATILKLLKYPYLLTACHCKVELSLNRK